jgi:hypothetical protein
MDFQLSKNPIDGEMLDIYYRGSEPRYNSLVATVFCEHFKLSVDQWQALSEGEELSIAWTVSGGEQ